MDRNTTRAWLTRRAELSPSAVALYDAESGMQALTYRAWHDRTAQTARLLLRLGVRRGDRVAALALNCQDLLDLWFACGAIGAIFHPLNWRLTADDLALLISDSSPVLFAYGRGMESLTAPLVSGICAGLIGLAIDDAEPAAHGHLRLSECRREAAEMPAVDVSGDTAWVLCNTGGSTGLPKAAVLTHGSIAANAVNTVVSWGLRADDTAILNAPLFHTGGLNVFTAPLVLIGGASVICRGFDAGQVLSLIDRRQVTLFFGVPTMFYALQQHAAWPTTDFGGMRLLIAGGAACPDPIRDEFARRAIVFKTGYGLTEAGPNTFWLPDEQVADKPGAVGYPLWDIETRIVDVEHGQEVAAHTVGELLIRGPHVCAGYWQRPDESAAVLHNGWLRTGDLARRDDDGCHWIVGRRKDIFISGGENIYPAEIENVLAGHPLVAEVAVIGMPDARWGEVGWALIVLRDGPCEETELTAYLAARLARFKLPRRYLFVDHLPRTGAGKVDRPAIRRRLSVESD